MSDSSNLIKKYKILENIILSYSDLCIKFKYNDRNFPDSLARRFLDRNEHAFKFLEITAEQLSGGNISLFTSRYIGCIPIISPITGLYGGYFTIEGSYGEDISELLSIIGDSIEPEFDDKLKFYDNTFVSPPLYYECMKYIDKYIEAKHYKWRKFTNIEKIQPLPSSSTKWEQYSLRSKDPCNTFKYPNKCNLLTCNHPEWQELNYVLNHCINEILSVRTPVRSRTAYISKINTLIDSYDKRSLPVVKEIKIHMSDPVVIKSLKTIANRVLNNNSSAKFAWRMDFAEFFERYVQFIFNKVAKIKGAFHSANQKYAITGNRPSWSLSYIEPDIILEKENTQYIIDAKYKAHMYNINNGGEHLKESFRADLHQVLAYSSFGGEKNKNVMLVYPSGSIINRELNIVNNNGYSCKVFLIGIPIRKSSIPDIIEYLTSIVVF